MNMGQFIDHNGRLAYQLSKYPMYSEPIMLTSLWVSPTAKAADNQAILEASAQEPKGTIVPIYYMDHRYNAWGRVDTTGWDHILIREQIAPPKNGKTYTWQWSGGEWRKEEYPFCSECIGGAIHNPDLPHCDECGYAHKPGGRHMRRARHTFGLMPA